MRVGVIGGGLTGLAAVQELRERGINAIGFEADAEPGGVIRSRRFDGTVVEYGPQRLRAGGITDEYLRFLDLDEELVTADVGLPIYVYADGTLREVPFGPRAMLRTDLLSRRSKLRLLLEPLTGPAREGETVAEYFTRKLGPQAYERGIEPLFGGLYGSDPAEMPVDVALRPIIAQERGRGVLSRLALRRLRSDEGRSPPAVPKSGMQALPERLYEEHEAHIHLETPIERIESTTSGYRLIAPEDDLEVAHVVVATDAPSASQLIRSIDEDTATVLDELRYNPLAMVYLQAPIDRRGLGFQVSRSEALHTLGVSWNGVAFGRDALHTVFFGGMHEPDLVKASDDTLIDIATDEFEQILGVEAEGVTVHRILPGMPAYDHSWKAFQECSTPTGLHLVGNFTDRVGIPGRLRQARRVAKRIAADQLG